MDRGRLIGASVSAGDLGRSACLVLAGLVTEGTTTVSRVYYLNRSYVKMEETLAAPGASISRLDIDTADAATAETGQQLTDTSV